jgi:hypothetical protein
LGTAEIKEARVTDQHILIKAIEKASVVIAEHIDPRIANATPDPKRRQDATS